MARTKTAIALGSFDGVHIGHMAVLDNTLKFKDKGMKAVALLFDCHPKSFFGVKHHLLLKNEDKIEIIKKMNLECEIISFEKVRDMTPREFFEEILVKEMNVGAVCCGYNYCFGKNSSGNVDELNKLCEEFCVQLCVSDCVENEDGIVSSSVIRELIKNGDITRANKMLGRNFFIREKVVHGAKRGHAMGFPTANQHFHSDMVIPKSGVYVSSTEVNGKIYKSFTDIGNRPTFGETEIRSETHIFDFDGDLYGKEIKVNLHKYLRSEKKFDSLEELVAQLNDDKLSVIQYFENII